MMMNRSFKATGASPAATLDVEVVLAWAVAVLSLKIHGVLILKMRIQGHPGKLQ